MIYMGVGEWEKFKKEWKEACERLKNCNADLSRIKIVPVVPGANGGIGFES